MESYQTILVVDDEKTNVEFIVSNLEQKYKIKTAPNGKVALKILEKFDIDLILLDIQMPVLLLQPEMRDVFAQHHDQQCIESVAADQPA